MRQSLSPPRMGLPNMTQKQKPVAPLDPNSNTMEAEKYEIKAGKLMLLHRLGQRTVKLPVYVRVYRNCFEHFAVISKDQVTSTNPTYVNLRTSYCVLPSDSVTQFEVVQNNFEGTVIRFDTGDKDTVAHWVEAFQCASPPASPTQGGMSPTLSPAIPRSPVMPTLPEIDEEE